MKLEAPKASPDGSKNDSSLSKTESSYYIYDSEEEESKVNEVQSEKQIEFIEISDSNS